MNDYIKTKLTYNVTMMVASTLCTILLAMVGAFVGGLFVSNDIIDNKDLFP